VIRLVVMMCVKYPRSLHNVEDLLRSPTRDGSTAIEYPAHMGVENLRRLGEWVSSNESEERW
jgi:hypothetical protein